MDSPLAPLTTSHSMYNMTPERTEKFKNVAHKRQGNLTVILENVHDPHNIGAVLRTCDAIGIHEIFILYTEEKLTELNISKGGKSSSGARKWVTINHYTDVERCFQDVRKKYQKIYATHLSTDASDLHDLDLTTSIALLFGNEHAGISEASLELVDGNYIIPQVGMVESLNISVACAVSLYEAYRQRNAKGFYSENPTTSAEEKTQILEEYTSRHKKKPNNINPKRR
ncbi:MAG: tRNA (guanosine-2'-O-)-methyltransferase [Saprospiraceae bacterium]